MKLDILTKQRIDKWFSEVTPDELLYITKKYLTQDQLQLLQSRVVEQSEQFNFFNVNYSIRYYRCFKQCELCKPKNI